MDLQVTTLSTGEIATFSCLLLTTASLYMPNIKNVESWWIALLLTCTVGAITGSIEMGGGLILAGFAYLLYLLKKESTPNWTKVLLRILTSAIFVGIAIHLVPLYHNVLMIDQQIVKPNSSLYSIYWNFDKSLIGMVLIGAFVRTSKNIKSVCKGIALPVLITIIITLILGVLLSLIKPQIVQQNIWLKFVLLFAPAQLLSTCLAEEAFFRGFVQSGMKKALVKRNYKHSAYIAIGISALLFGLVHLGAGISYAIVSTAAGIGYGYVYNKTGRIESAIVCHFLLNLTHYTFFTYPIIG